MSADNWTSCIRCRMRTKQSLSERQEEVNKLYGVVPVEEFDRIREELKTDLDSADNEDLTFREDYEFYGAETGIVTAEYRGQCTQCGLSLKFTYHHPIPGALPS